MDCKILNAVVNMDLIQDWTNVRCKVCRNIVTILVEFNEEIVIDCPVCETILYEEEVYEEDL